MKGFVKHSSVKTETKNLMLSSFRRVSNYDKYDDLFTTLQVVTKWILITVFITLRATLSLWYNTTQIFPAVNPSTVLFPKKGKRATHITK